MATFHSRIVILIVVGLCYLLITLHLAKIQQKQCPSINKIGQGDNDYKVVPPVDRNFEKSQDHIEASEYLLNSMNFPPDAIKNEIKAPAHQMRDLRETIDEKDTKLKVTQNLNQPSKHAYAVDILSPETLLQPGYAPNSVFYVWCGRRWFEFHHYLSVLSVIKELRPDNIIFYYDEYPIQDYWLYNTWMQEIRDHYPFFRVRRLLSTEYGCSTHSTPNMTFVHSMLSLKGGMYINEHTIITKYPLHLRNYTVINALDESTGRGFLLVQRGLPIQNGLKLLMADPLSRSHKISCGSITSYIAATQKPLCVVTTVTFFPKDIWELNNDFGRLVRHLFYDSPDINLPAKRYDELIPNIAHIVWIGGGEMDYLFYLCVLSLIYVAEVEKVYIHGDAPPTGLLWMRIKDNPRLHLIFRETPKLVYGTQVNIISHVTDVWRVDFMIRYGGIYVDTDTIFVRPLDRDIRAYDAVGSYDWTYWNSPFPDTINFGVAIGKRNAKYWKMFQESMKWFIDADWSWNGLRQPYRIKERHPELVLIDPHLQVICYEFKCHPTWWPDYHNESLHHLNSPSIKDWQKDAYAFHFTLPTPPELLSEDNLLSANSMFGEIGRNVLHKAGLLK